MAIDQYIQQKIYRLETLRRYQAYYGPNTPYQIVAEINQLEAELRRFLQADLTRPTQNFQQPFSPAQPAKKVGGGARKKKRVSDKKKATKASPPQAQTKVKDKKGLFGLSQSTFDNIVTVGFIGFVFLLGMILFVAYKQYGPPGRSAPSAVQEVVVVAPVQPTLRPTFTPTADPNSPGAAVDGAANNSASDAIEVAMVNQAGLPAPNSKVATPIPTPVPTITPNALLDPTETPAPLPTDTPVPPPPPPPPRQQAPADTPTPAPPPPTPAPTFPFVVKEQGNRNFQKTNYHGITVYIAIVNEANQPLGGLKVIGDHSPSGTHVESGLSDWHWSATNCLDCDYIKFGNLKFEPGTFSDGVWSIYVTDGSGAPLSPAVPLAYASDPAQWVWDFVIFEQKSQ